MSYVHISSQRAEQHPFRLESVASAPAPSGCAGAWSRYVITQGSNTIVGLRAGESNQVGGVVAQYVEQLNQRCAKQRMKAAR